MPRRSSASATTVTSAFRQVQKQARSLMINLRKEIRSKETELRRLKEEESRLSMLIAGPSAPRVSARAGGAAPRSGRVNWRLVLDQLPKQFKASDVRSIRGVKEKRPSEIFAAITRWIQAGAARRKTRGMYERTAR